MSSNIVFPDLDRLLSQLNVSGIQISNPALFQVISQLITFDRRIQAILLAQINGPSGPVSNIANQNFITWANNVPVLPNSRQAIAGTGITLDTSLPGQIEISSSGGGGTDYVVASNGDPADPLPLNDGAGNFIYVAYTPP